ncbi:MAG TPA: pectate lyase, partial [bacterium]|nr:pectate lyase [bacterium]
NNDAAGTAYQRVLAEAGTTLPKRDPVDSRVVRQVEKGIGKIIDSQREVGSWPAYQSIAPPADSDADGMPDEWEKKYDFDAWDPKDGPLDRDGDGYTNIEEYLNDTDPGEANE